MLGAGLSPQRCFFMINKDKYIQRFIAVFEQKTGNKISPIEALDYFEKLIVLTNAIYQPIPKKCMAKKHVRVVEKK